MKYFLLLLGLGTASLASASQLGLGLIKQPLYLHGSDGDVEIRIVDVPVASSGPLPEGVFPCIALPFVPPGDSTAKDPGNVNMASAYGLRVNASEDSNGDILVWRITVDATTAKRPEGYPFTIEQVIDATVTCIKMMCPPKDEAEHKVIVSVLRPKAKK